MIAPIEKEPDTREHVLSTAAQLFAERGFANVSIRDICDEAGVTAPTIYHYFGNKDRLFQAAIECTEEAIYNSLTMATTTSGYRSLTVQALPLEEVGKLIRRYKG